MTTNNLIHELGHSFSRFAGFGYDRVGSIEQALSADGMPLLRDGMARGLVELKEQFFEHAHIRDINADGAAEFDPLPGVPTTYSPSDYLMYDLFDTRFALWSRLEYTSLYGSIARVDTLVHNAAPTAVETAADAFLNWVRSAFDASPSGQSWINFFNQHVGKFLRNAAIRQQGMIAYYVSAGLIPGTPIRTITIKQDDTYAVRLEAAINENNQIGTADSLLALPPSNVSVYGWTPGAGFD